MARRWSAEDIEDLKTLAQNYSVQAIAEKMDRSVGGVAFKAHQLGTATQGALAGDWSGAHGLQLGQRATTGRPRLTNGSEGSASRRKSVPMRSAPSRCGRHPAHGRRRCPR
jgi:hypothetical protein